MTRCIAITKAGKRCRRKGMILLACGPTQNTHKWCCRHHDCDDQPLMLMPNPGSVGSRYRHKKIGTIVRRNGALVSLKVRGGPVYLMTDEELERDWEMVPARKRS